VRHAVQARRWSLAGTIFTRAALPRIQTTDRHALAAALAQIPAAELGATAELQLCAATVCMAEGRYAQIGPYLDLARSMLEQDGAADPSTSVALNLYESSLARARGTAGRTLAAADEALSILDRHAGAVPLAQAYRAIAINLRGVGLLWSCDTGAAAAALQAGLDASVAAGIELTLVNDLGHLALAAVVTGRLTQAEDWADRCVTLADARGWSDLVQASGGYLAAALVAVARNDLAEAERSLALGMQTQRRDPEPLMRLGLRTARAAVDTAKGRHDSARSQLTSIRDELETIGVADQMHRWLARAEADLALATGTHAELRARLEELEPARRSADETLQLARARLADGDAESADELLAPVGHQDHLDVVLAVEASVVRALSADRLRRDDQALQLLERAPSDAAAEHLVAPFLSAGTTRMRALLERVVLLRTVHADFARTLLDILESAHPVDLDNGLVEPVTERERTVLRYLTTMLSNAEIAEEMFLSPNTVKVHLRHVYRKLDVTSRRAAVRRARELRLLEDDDGP
jgi:LuxR family maltose regulon positive regulatory protein